MGVLDFLRDAMPGAVAARVGYQQGQQQRQDRAAAEAERQATALRQKMQDEREQEWHDIRVNAAKQPKVATVTSAGVVNPLDGTIEDVYSDGTRRTVRKATAAEIRKATRVPGDDGPPRQVGTWQPDPNTPGLYVHSGTGETKRLGSTDNLGAQGAKGLPPAPKVAQQLRDKLSVVNSQIDDTRADLSAANDSFAPDSAEVERLRVRGDSLGGVRDSLAAELLGTPIRRGGSGMPAPAVPLPEGPVTFESPKNVQFFDNVSPLQEDYNAAAAALEAELQRAGSDPVKQRAARARYERLVARIAEAEQRARAGR